jgi:DNA-binding SARP family transcriptional activator
MDSSLSSNQETFTLESGISSSLALLEQGLHRLRQGRYVEGITLCEVAREGLLPEQIDLTRGVDAFLESYRRYKQAEKTLHESSRHFIEAEKEQQTLLLTVEKTLIASEEKVIHTSSPSYTSAQTSNGFQGSQALDSAQSLANSHTGNQSTHPLQVSFGDRTDDDTLPNLDITCFGHFEVRRLGKPIMLCQNRNGQTILRYLVAQPGYQATVDKLVAILWPEDEMEVARHKVQVAVSALRHVLNHGLHCTSGSGYILCKNRVYQINPVVSITSDVEQFLALHQLGRQSNKEVAMSYYEQACQLYTGPFLVEDMYADWSAVRREQLSQRFVTMSRALSGYYLEADHYEEAEQWARAQLLENRCDEIAHRQLIQIYVAQRRRTEAIRQYQLCERILAEELGIPPMAETMALLRGGQILGNTLQRDDKGQSCIE